MTLNEAVIKIRVELQNSGIKQTGYNKFGKGFKYFELGDFLPKLNELMLNEGVNDLFSFSKDIAILTLIKGEEKQSYEMPSMYFDVLPNGMQPIQYLGALNTYYKRYLYMNAFGITDGEIIDSIDNTKVTPQKKLEAEKDKKWLNEDQLIKVAEWLIEKGYEVTKVRNFYKVNKENFFKLENEYNKRKK